MRHFHLAFLIITAIVLLAGCTPFNADNADSTSQSLAGPVFIKTEPSPSPSQSADPIPSPSPSQTADPIPSPSPTPSVLACSETGIVSAVQAVIQTAPATDWVSSAKAQGIQCGIGIQRFAARAVSASGATLHAIQIQNSNGGGLYTSCDGNIDMFPLYFEAHNIRPQGSRSSIDTTYLCTFGSDPLLSVPRVRPLSSSGSSGEPTPVSMSGASGPDQFAQLYLP